MEDMLRKAHDVHQAGDLNKAELMYDHMLNFRPNNWLLQFFLGTLYFQKKRNGLAINLLTRCLEQKPDMHEGWTNLGCAYRAENMMEEAMESFQKSLDIVTKLDDKDQISQLKNNIGSIYVAAGNPAPGEQYLKDAIEINPLNLQAYWNLSLVLLEQEKWEEAWPYYDKGIETGDRLNRNFDCDWWDGKPDKDKTLIVYGEQGLGDEIMFYSIIPDVMKDVGKVVIECNPRMTDLIDRSFPDVEVYGTRKQDWIDWPTKYENRAKIALGSLGRLYRNKEADWPEHEGYLVPATEKMAVVRAKLDKLGHKPKVGISWFGGSKKTRNDLRSATLTDLLPLLKQKDYEFISLQYGKEAQAQVDEFYGKYGITIHHWPEWQASEGKDSEYDWTAALVQECDVIITVPTSVVHLAGALNKDTIVLNPFESQWREGLTRPNMIWYKNQTTMLRKEKGESWNRTVLEAMELLDGRMKVKATA